MCERDREKEGNKEEEEGGKERGEGKSFHNKASHDLSQASAQIWGSKTKSRWEWRVKKKGQG